MPTIDRRGFALLMATVFLCCGCLPTEHPLSDEKTSTPDAKLIGEWQIINGHAGPPSVCYIGRKHGEAKVLEMVLINIDEHGEAVIEHADLFITKVGDLNLVSYHGSDDKHYQIVRYEMPDADRIDLYYGDEASLKKAIADGLLHGELETELNKQGIKVVTDSAEDLRKFITVTGERCFDTESPSLSFNRVRRDQ